jgi:hypothetical protein
MGLKSYITVELLLEGGKALKNTNGIKQKHVKPLLALLLPQLAKELSISPSFVLPVGSAGRKSDQEALSGDIDIAIQTDDIEAIRRAIAALGVDGSYREMAGINVYSFAAAHPDGLVQVDLMPVHNINLAAWAFYSAESDLAQGLKGSHRNELLFALAKHVAMKHIAADGVPDAERQRYQLSLNHGLFHVAQTRLGKKGRPLKSYTTANKKSIATDPDEICELLFGYKVPAAAVLSFADALRAMNDSRFKFKEKRSAIIASTIEGLKRKELILPPCFLSDPANLSS